MSMHSLEWRDVEKYADITFDICKPVKVYYLVYGRNAWHSTWITRYFPGCMSSSFKGARREAEAARVQGSVFHIRELPALQFVNSKLSVVITEINSDAPLLHWQDRALYPDVNLLELYQQFSPPKPHSVIRLLRHTVFAPQAGIKQISNRLETVSAGDTLQGYRSCVYRTGYTLGWTNVENKITTSPIRTLAKAFGRGHAHDAEA